ncbi:MAG: alpha/beta hydrolase, partial [Pseudomonadota bacterium]
MTKKLFIHGVPDTPHVWEPLVEALGDLATDISTPALPGFTEPPPPGFEATKEAYTDWLIGQTESMAVEHGPIDIVGHDWGATLTLRAASLRPDLFRSWTVTNAVISAEYKGHRAAKIWATPMLGELFMWSSRNPERLRKALEGTGFPDAIFDKEMAFWTKEKRQNILSLYRSAAGLSFRGQWVDDLVNLPSNGFVIRVSFSPN